MKPQHHTLTPPQTESLGGENLIRLCQAGDQAAFNQFTQQYLEKIYTYVAFAADDAARAAELTRDIFLAAYRQFPRYAAEEPVNVWLLSLADRHLRQAAARQIGWRRFLPAMFRHAERQPDAAQASEVSDCAAAQDKLSEYLDGELNEVDAKRVEKHLQQCATCWQAFESLQETVLMLQSVGRKTAPRDLRPQILAAIEQMTPARDWGALFRSVPVLQFTSVSLSLAVLLLGSYLWMQRHPVVIDDTQEVMRGSERDGAFLGETGDLPHVFVILTGKFVSDEMPLEIGAMLDGLPSEPDKVKFWFLPGAAAPLAEQISQQIEAMQGRVVSRDFQEKNGIVIGKIVAELPQNPSTMFSKFLETLRAEPAARRESPQQPLPAEFSIYLVEKR